MLKVGICDDDALQRKQIHKWIEETLFQYTEFSIAHFSTGEEVVAAIEKDEFQIQLLILDVHMKTLDGIDTAAFIRKQNVDTDIIFVTISPEHVYDGYIHKAFAYLLKPVTEAAFKKVLGQYMDEWGRGTQFLEMNLHGSVQRINLRKVLYMTSDIRVIEVHMSDKVERYYGKLDDIEKQLSKVDFIRCHKSFLVNKSFVDSMNREYFMVCGEQIPVSRRYYEKMREEGVFKKNKMRDSSRMSLAGTWSQVGALVGIKGKYTGAIIRMKAEQQITIGRDQDIADIVLDDIGVSRKHCWIQYNAMEESYYICDESTNGVLVNATYYLEKGKVVVLKKGDELHFPDTMHVFKLG